MVFRCNSLRTRILSGVALSGMTFGGMLALAAPAQAQDASQTSATDDSGGLKEIVVTAQHREELLRDVPIAVNAVAADTLQSVGISDTTALVQAVPSLNFTRSGPSGIFVIRGVATPNGAAGEEGSTAVYVDDVYMPDLSSTINTFNNIQRIEVLNGPQGTLFGRNAAGGLIRVITRDPGDRPTLDARLGYGNYDIFSGQLYAATPLGEKAGIDIAFTGQDQGKGFGFDPTLGRDVRKQDYWGLRSKLVAQPTDAIKITLSGDYYRTDDSTATYVWPLNYVTTTGVLTGRQASQDSFSAYDNGTHIRVWGVSGKLEWDFGGITLTSISAYRKLKNHSNFDVDGAAPDTYHLFYDTRNRSFQQELRLSSNDTDPLSWQVGAFYLHTVTDVDQTQDGTVFRGTQTKIRAHGITDSISAFGEVTYAITPTTHLTGGVRWTSDHRKLPLGYTGTTLNGVFIPGTAAAPNPKFNAINSVTYNNVTFRGALRQDITDTVNVYASVNKGFKSGEFNLQAPELPPVRPETIMAYEAGLKGDLLDRHLRLSLAAFHYDIKDYQVRTTYPNPNGLGVITGLYNAAKAKVDGVDINAEAAVTDMFHLTAGAAWLNSRFSQFGGPGTNIVAPGYYPASRAGNATGNQTPLAPHFTLNVLGTLTVPFENGSELRFTAGVTHKSSYVFEPDNVFRQGAYNVVNGSIEFKPTENYAIEVYARNVGDELYNIQMNTALPAYALAGAPRQYGINFKVTY